MGKPQVPEYVKEIRSKLKGEENYTNEAIKKILSENGIEKYPINVFDIARKLGITIKFAVFKDNSVSGILWDGKEPVNFDVGSYQRVIFINNNESPQRQVFTVAHEIGHFMLHCNDESNFYERYISKKSPNVPDELKKMEDSADYFAANLLLPRDILQRYILVNCYTNDDEIESAVTRDFFVEKETIKRRLEEIRNGR